MNFNPTTFTADSHFSIAIVIFRGEYWAQQMFSPIMGQTRMLGVLIILAASKNILRYLQIPRSRYVIKFSMSSSISSLYFIDQVEFESELLITGIIIYETLSVGSIKRILGLSSPGHWEILWETASVQYLTYARIFSPYVNVIPI